MQNETWNPVAAITGTTSGMLAGMYQTLNGSSLLYTITTSAITAAVSCIISFLVQQLLNKTKR